MTDVQDPIAEVVAQTEQVSLEEAQENTHVHDENCTHDHDHDHEHDAAAAAAAAQQRNDYDLLETNNTKDKTTDPLVKNYFEAKELFEKSMTLLNAIPEGAEPELIEKHKDEIVEVTKGLMKAFLLDEKACVMNQRILKLAEQYEVYVQTHNPEGTSTATVDSEEEDAEQQTTIYTKDSVVFGTFFFLFFYSILGLGGRRLELVEAIDLLRSPGNFIKSRWNSGWKRSDILSIGEL